MWAIVVAGGSGSRFGRPKQFELLSGKPVVAWALAGVRSAVDGIVLVVPGTEIDRARELGADVVVAGADSRSGSVRCGLERVPDDAGTVIVHDAARPLASPALFAAVLEPLRAASTTPHTDAVICALPVADTLKRLGPDGSTVAGTLDRNGIVVVQTPQAFRADVLRRAHASGSDATDDAALVEAIGGVVRVVPGESHNVKLTVPSDLVLLEHLLAARGAGIGPARSAP